MCASAPQTQASLSGVSSQTPHAHGYSSLGCDAAMASEHDVDSTTGAGAFEKSSVFSIQVQACFADNRQYSPYLLLISAVNRHELPEAGSDNPRLSLLGERPESVVIDVCRGMEPSSSTESKFSSAITLVDKEDGSKTSPLNGLGSLCCQCGSIT
jgi:hypothetical protein